MAAKKKSTKKAPVKRKTAPAKKAAAPANCMAVARENRRLKAKLKELTK